MFACAGNVVQKRFSSLDERRSSREHLDVCMGALYYIYLDISISRVISSIHLMTVY